MILNQQKNKIEKLVQERLHHDMAEIHLWKQSAPLIQIGSRN